jgi:hypothetical protein
MISIEDFSVIRSAGYQPAACIAQTTSPMSPISPTFRGSPGMPCAVRVTIGMSASPR